MPFNLRQLDPWLTLWFGVLAFGHWTFHGLQAASTDNPLSTKALFVWLAAAMAGLVLGITLAIFTAPLRAKRLWANPATDPRDLNFPLTAGIFCLGAEASPVYSSSAGTWEWSFLAVSAFVGALAIGGNVIVRGERRFQPAAPWPHQVPGHPGW